MRKLMVILLISVHLAGNTELGQVMRFPQLIAHYFQHARLNPSINFFEFIAMHYGGDDGTTADDDFDNQLPCHNISHNTMAVVYSPMVQEIPSVSSPFFESKEYNSRLENSTASKHVLLILQPPRLA
jgi:hypothetical protein